jgi:hypothetical protein
VIIGVLILLPLILYDIKNGISLKDFLNNLTASAIEVFILGLIILVYNKLNERKDIIRRYKEEIDGYRPWKEDEATYRICGLVRNLNNHNVSDIDLSDCYLPNAPLRKAQLQGANLGRANLFRANLQGADLREARVDSKDWLLKLEIYDIRVIEYIKEKYSVVEEEIKGEIAYIIKEKKS